MNYYCIFVFYVVEYAIIGILDALKSMKWGMNLKIKIFCSLIFFLVLAPRGFADRRYIVKFNQNINVMESLDNSRRNFLVVTERELDEYLASGMIEYYEPDCEIELFTDYDSVMNDGLWNHNAINLNKAWKIGCFGNDVRIGVIDSGVNPHSCFEDRIIKGACYIPDKSDTYDNIGHGTYVSGIIAAGLADKCINGIAPRAEIVPLKCFDNGVITTASMIADAIYDAVDIYDCDVINMSFGMEEALTNKTLKLSVMYAVECGVIVVASCGNDGNQKEYYPAKYDGVVGVGAVNIKDELSWFSQRNTTVDITAPGEAVESVKTNGYSKNSGTSFAAPHVSAAAAIAKCIDKSITSGRFLTLIESTARIPDEYNEYYGAGIINIGNMTDELLKNTNIYISPQTDDNVIIYNNSENIMPLTAVQALYSPASFAGCGIHNLLLSPGETEKITINASGVSKIILLDNLKNLKPLSKAKEYAINR